MERKVLVTQSVSTIRRWTEERQGWPCRRLDGRLDVGFAGEACRGIEIGWNEFEPTFCALGAVFVLDDAPESRTCFVGPPDEARRFLADLQGWAPLPARSPAGAAVVLPPGEELAGVSPRPRAGEAR